MINILSDNTAQSFHLIAVINITMDTNILIKRTRKINVAVFEVDLMTAFS